jgi:hypothetical protein
MVVAMFPEYNIDQVRGGCVLFILKYVSYKSQLSKEPCVCATVLVMLRYLRVSVLRIHQLRVGVVMPSE